MAGVFGAHVLQALKLLTPMELDRLTDALTTSEKVKKVSVVSEDGAVDVDAHDLDEQSEKQEGEQGESDDLSEFEAQVLPFRKKSQSGIAEGSTDDEEEAILLKEEEKPNEDPRDGAVPIPTHPGVAAESRLEKAGIYSHERMMLEKQEAEKKEKDKRPSTTVFILSEKEKTKRSQSKLQGQVARAVYATQAAVDVANADKEDMSKSTVQGVLLDKKT